VFLTEYVALKDTLQIKCQKKGRLLQRVLNFALNKIGAGAKFETFCIPRIFGFGVVGDTFTSSILQHISI